MPSRHANGAGKGKFPAPAFLRLCDCVLVTTRHSNNAVEVMFATRGKGAFASDSAEAKHQWHTKWLLLMFVF
ncbi:protein of unknown function [Cupriavidus taiwanensis]|uniref:Uncharacterized protein n=1 Tax=Cupriavidus taiwanensis TaxID=164546 RepID=A0A375FLB8_9BURK|nr:protein of unknown function [Cupriavidus taiwanensis]SPC05241.1 hypothetical protein CT19431_10007 [Cupriavidus taiwanensis]SPC07553.1 hypothetical protein CBM2594_A110008 [Cupriavidus taiwanensis]SPD42085.1 protein of unknown function [Cupriavidus taiwanensis]